MTTSSSNSLSKPQLLVANSLCFVSCKAIKTYIVRKPGNEAKMQSICDFQYRKGSVTLQIFLCAHEYSNNKLYCLTVGDGRFTNYVLTDLHS